MTNTTDATASQAQLHSAQLTKHGRLASVNHVNQDRLSEESYTEKTQMTSLQVNLSLLQVIPVELPV